MALISCPKCGKQISDKAASCPNCGSSPAAQTSNIFPAPIQPEVKAQKPAINPSNKIIIIVGAVVSALLIALIVVILATSSGNSPKGSGIQNNNIVGNTQANQGNNAGESKINIAAIVPTTYNVNLSVYCTENIVMNKYDVDILVDGEVLTTLAHGSSDDYKLQLPEGSHSIEFRINGKKMFSGDDIYNKNDKDTYEVMTLYVTKNMDVSYTVNLTSSNSIKVKLN